MLISHQKWNMLNSNIYLCYSTGVINIYVLWLLIGIEHGMSEELSKIWWLANGNANKTIRGMKSLNYVWTLFRCWPRATIRNHSWAATQHAHYNCVEEFFQIFWHFGLMFLKVTLQGAQIIIIRSDFLCWPRATIRKHINKLFKKWKWIFFQKWKMSLVFDISLRMFQLICNHIFHPDAFQILI